MIKRRITWAFAIGVVLIAIVVAGLLFADSYAITDEAKQCAPHFPEWLQLPKWFGCTMAAHEALAGGLIGGAGALFAAWVAFTAVREQLAEDRRREQLAEDRSRRRRRQIEAKATALACITPSIHTAANALHQIIAALCVAQAAEQNATDKGVELALAQVQATSESFAVREVVRYLAVDDRVMYLRIVNTLSTLVNISNHPSPFFNREQRLQSQHKVLTKLYEHLEPFDSELAEVYLRDSGPPLSELNDEGKV